MTEIIGQYPPLSPDLARQDPETFKDSLLNSLEIEHPVARTAWERSVERGDVSLKRLRVDPNSWIGIYRHSERTITLGVQPLPDNIKEQVLFDHQTFDYKKQVIYRLSHEAAHPVIFAMGDTIPEVNQIYSALTAQRAATGRGLSGLGSLAIYRNEGPEVQALEDLTELVNMYMLDPRKFTRYLNFLQNPLFAAVRDRLDISELDNDTRKVLADTVTRIVSASIF